MAEAVKPLAFRQTLDSSIVSDDNDSVVIWPDPDEATSSNAELTVIDDGGFPFQSLLLLVADLATKVILFQICLLFSPFTLPIWLLHQSLQILRCARDCVMEMLFWISKGLIESICSKIHKKLKSQQEFLKRLAWGIVSTLYVLSVLFGLLVIAFIAGGMVMQRVVEKPILMTKDLNFDYTKSSPDAFGGLGNWDDVPLGSDSEGKIEVENHVGWHFVPPSHKLKLTISLTLPESDYNWKLGVFQVKAEFLSREGRVMESSSHPCMLRFKSSTIRYLGTFINSVSLLAGYSLESQTLYIEMRGFTQGIKPPACIRVILEHRAQHMAGAGIPEIYSASMKLESELPLFKKAMWNWRWTLLIWVSMGLFMLKLFVILLCCSPIIVSKTRPEYISYKQISHPGKTNSYLKA